jgi:hypothetical protein
MAFVGSALICLKGLYDAVKAKEEVRGWNLIVVSNNEETPAGSWVTW